jgi:hypothetical protein
MNKHMGWKLLLLLLVGLTGCLGPVPRRGAPLPEVVPPAPEVIAVPEPVEVPVLKKARVVAIWAPGGNTDVLGAAHYLAERPGMKVTALFPEHFFGDDEKSKRAKALFQTLVSSKQVEVVLTLPEQPVLPLIMDTANARLSTSPVSALPSAFSWPEDVIDQMGVARDAYRRRWRVPPTGMKLPWGVVLGPEIPLIAKFKSVGLCFPRPDPRLPLLMNSKFPSFGPVFFRRWRRGKSGFLLRLRRCCWRRARWGRFKWGRWKSWALLNFWRAVQDLGSGAFYRKR